LDQSLHYQKTCVPPNYHLRDCGVHLLATLYFIFFVTAQAYKQGKYNDDDDKDNINNNSPQPPLAAAAPQPQSPALDEYISVLPARASRKEIRDRLYAVFKPLGIPGSSVEERAEYFAKKQEKTLSGLN
jgi:hypothetical protein